ncbi:hypothetical protein [Caulobacter sp. UC70_42]|jgi:hypothetical protein
MPSRQRPTARLLTPAGWTGVFVAALLAAGLAFAALSALPRA